MRGQRRIRREEQKRYQQLQAYRVHQKRGRHGEKYQHGIRPVKLELWRNGSIISPAKSYQQTGSDGENIGRPHQQRFCRGHQTRQRIFARN